MQRRLAAICAALVIIAATPALAQEPALELQLGGGFLLADSDLSSLPSVEAGVVLWWSNSWGFSMRRGVTIGEHMASYDYGDGTRTGSRNFRHWTPTLRYRRALDSALELNLGVGLTFGAYDHLIWRPGAERNPRADHFSMGGLATEALVGKRITRRMGIKAGLIVYPFLDERAAVAPVGFAVVSF